MKKRILAHLLSLAILLAIFPAMELTAMAAGDSESDPILISTAEELADLATSVNAGNAPVGKYYRLTTNIDLSEIGRASCRERV